MDSIQTSYIEDHEKQKLTKKILEEYGDITLFHQDYIILLSLKDGNVEAEA